MYWTCLSSCFLLLWSVDPRLFTWLIIPSPYSSRLRQFGLRSSFWSLILFQSTFRDTRAPQMIVFLSVYFISPGNSSILLVLFLVVLVIISRRLLNCIQWILNFSSRRPSMHLQSSSWRGCRWTFHRLYLSLRSVFFDHISTYTQAFFTYCCGVPTDIQLALLLLTVTSNYFIQDVAGPPEFFAMSHVVSIVVSFSTSSRLILMYIS